MFPLDHDNQGFRSSATYAAHLDRATSALPVKGVKGVTELSKIIKLPDSLSFDIMHLVYHGAAKSFLSAVIGRKLVDVSDLSFLIESFQVPHHFRRKPRNVTTELTMWKSQEHKNFLLYIGPVAFFLLSGQNSNNVFSVYYLLAVAIYVMSDEQCEVCLNVLKRISKNCVDRFKIKETRVS